MDGIHKKLWILFQYGHLGTRSKLEQSLQIPVNSAHFRENYIMFSSMKMEEYMEPELFDIFSSKTVSEKNGAWVPGDPFHAYQS